jgi:putative phage-type endonuclease
MRVELTQGSPEWLAFREGRIGSSDAPVIVGESPYKSTFQLWAERVTGTPVELDEGTKRLFRMGHLFETPLLDHYAQERGVPVERGPVFLSDELPFLSASLDGLAGDRIVEAKYSNADDWPHEGVPDHVVIQAQHQMYVTGFEVVDVVALIRGYVRIVEVPRDPALIDDVLSLEGLFHAAVLDRTPLPSWIDGSEGSRKAILRIYPTNTARMRAADPEAIALVTRLLDLREDLRVLAAEVDTTENAVRFLIGESEGVEGPGFRVTYRNRRDGVKVGWEQVAFGYRTLLEQSGASPETLDTIRSLYTAEVPGARVLRVNRTEE